MSAPTLRLAGPLEQFPVSRLNGPGERWVLWLQGCSLRCTEDCLNPELLTAHGGRQTEIGEVLAELERRRARHALEGVTFLGGEPFDQAPALASLAEAVHGLGLSVVTYTGWVLETLLRRGPEGSRALLARSDLLIDGPYLAHRYSRNLLWRGSDNQRLILLSDRYSRQEIEDAAIIKGVDVSFRGDAVRISGAQDRPMLDNILRRLRSSGFALNAGEGER